MRVRRRFVAGIVERAPGLALEDHQARARGVEDIDGSDFGLVGTTCLSAGRGIPRCAGLCAGGRGVCFSEISVNFLMNLHRGDEFLGEFFVLLVLPGGGEGGEAGLQRGGFALHIVVEALQFLSEAPDLLGSMIAEP